MRLKIIESLKLYHHLANVMRSYAYFFLTVFFFFGCNEKKDSPDSDPELENPLPFKSNYSISSLSTSQNFSQTGKLVSAVDLPEVSGLAESQINKGALWAHNDKGNSNSIFLLEKSTGQIKAEYRLQNMENKDWEDIEVGPGPETGSSYIYIANIGDNSNKRESVSVYRFKEPEFDPSHEGKITDLELDFDVLSFTYPGGSKDAETLLLDHASKDLYIISKRDFPAKIYIFPFPQDAQQTTKLTFAGTIPLLVPVGGNVHPNGGEVIIKTYDKIFYWKHDVKKPLWQTLSSIPEIAPYNPVEPQGEAVGFDENGGYFTLSEKEDAAETYLYFYEKLK